MLMRHRGLAALVVAVVAFPLAAVASGAAKPTKFSATLSAKQEVPKVTTAPSQAGGTFTATLSGSTLTWSLKVAHLTGPVTSAHIALGPKGTLGTSVIRLCEPCKSSHTIGHVKVSSSTVDEIKAGYTYVNVTTKKNAKGEIRGQIS